MTLCKQIQLSWIRPLIRVIQQFFSFILYRFNSEFIINSLEPNLQYKVDEWERQVLAQANETIGYSKIPIISDRKICWYTECTGAALMADAARAYLEKYTTSGNEWANTVAATVWHGGALSDTDLDIGAGNILNN